MKKGWISNRLGAITTKIGSGATPRGGEESYKESGTPLIRSLNVHDWGFKEAKLARIDDAQAAQLSNVVVEPDDVLLNITGASVARCCVAPTEFLPARVNQHVSIIRPRKDEVSSAFLQYLLISQTYKDRLLHTGEAGSTRQAITKAQIEDFIIEYPKSLPEQRRIVGILDEAFEGLATAKANAEKNLQNARALFESHLQSVFSQRPLSGAEGRGKGWVETTVGQHVDFLAGFAFKSSQYTDSEDGVRLVRGDNIVQGEFRWDGVKRWPKKSAADYSQFAFEENDVVLAMDRPWVAAGLKVAFVTKSDLPSLQVQRTARLRAKSSLHWKYLFHLIRSSSFVAYLLDGQTGLGVPHISGKQILSFEFSLPPLTEQKKIVANLDSLQEETTRLAAIYQQKLAALEALKKSLLHQAFSGEL